MLATATSASSASSSSNAHHGGIQTLREHQATNILSQANVTSSGMFPRPCWRSSATTSKQQQQQQQQDDSSSKLIDSSSSGGSCLQNAWPAQLQQLGLTSCASRETIVRNNNNRLLLFDVRTGSSSNSSSSTSGASCRQQQQEAPQGVTGISGNGVSFGSKASALHVASATISSSSAEEAAAAAANEMYDPEALLLEPLLISPRSDRQNTSRSDSGGARAHANSITSTSTINVVCENLLQDDRIMSQSIGRSGSGSQHLAGGITGPRWETDDPASSMRPLVPASPPSLSGVQKHQGESPPFFIPDQQQATRGGRRPEDCSSTSTSTSSATAAGGGISSSSSGGGGWYLNSPPNLQHQHQHFHHRAISAAAGPPPTAANFATVAASVAAEISKAAIVVAPSSFATPGSPPYPPIEHGMRAAGEEGITSFPGGGASGGATSSGSSSSSSSSGGRYDIYNSPAAPDGSQQQQLSWPTTAPGQQQQQQQQQQRSSMGGASAGSSYRKKQQPRFVTREDCVPGSRDPRDGSNSGLVEDGRSAAAATAGMQQQFLHGFGMDVPPFLRSTTTTEGGSGSSSSNVSGWHSAPSSTAAAAAAAIMGGGGPSSQHHQPSSSSGVKRPHSQLAVGISSSGGGIPSSATATTSASCPLPYADGSLSSSAAAAAGAGVVPQMAVRLTPMMLSASCHQGPGGKKMKVLRAADGSRGWTNLPRDSGSSSSSATGNDNNNWRGGASAAAAAAAGVRVTTVLVPDSMNDATSGNNSNNNQPHNGGGGLAASAAAPSSASSPAEAAAAAARAALAAAFPPTTRGANGGGGAGDNDEESSGGDSSPDWTEKDESEEEPDAAPAAPVRTTSGGRGGKKTKTPFMLDPKLWTVVERRAVCTAKQCAYRSEEDHRARRRHYHALCNHVHQNGERKGMRFQHHQLEKVQKHQRAHQNTQRSSIGSSAAKPRSPTTVAAAPRNKRVAAATSGQKEQTRAIKDANVEAHSPKDWTPELTKRLRDLVDELGPKWSNIADKMPGKTATACMLHWRVGVNPDHMVKGSGTWTAEEDERLSKLVEVVGMKWSDLARHIPGRIAKQCRERYLNHLDPSLRKDMPWTEDEEALLMRLCFAKQNQWAEICRQLHGRSYNDVKNRFNLIQRRNKRAQGSPTTTTTAPPATAQLAPLPTPAPVPSLKPIRRGRAGAVNTKTIDMKVSLSLNGVRSNSGGGAAYGGPIPRTRGGNMPVNNVAATATTSFASGRAMAAGGWGPAAAAAAAATATATATASHGGGSSSSSNGVSSATAAMSSSLGLMGDELGEFGIDGADSALPGSGFAPGGYWHQMVKEEARVARESDDEGSAKSTAPLRLPQQPAAAPLSSLAAASGGAGGGAGGDAASVVDPSPTGGAARFSQNGSPLP